MFTLEEIYILIRNMTILEQSKILSCLNKMLEEKNIYLVMENNKVGYEVKDNVIIAYNDTESALNDVWEYLGIKLCC